MYHIVSYPYSYIHRRCLLLMYNHVISDVGCNMHIPYVIHVPIRGQPMRLGDSHVTEIYIYMNGPLEKVRSFLLNHIACIYL